MLILISPSKTLDMTPANISSYSVPLFLEDTKILVKQLKNQESLALSKLMSISSKLADLNYERYQMWNAPFTKDNAKAAALSFKGDVYTGLNAESFDKAAWAFAQKHLRILSGLYGLLKPLDLMQAYRLEMGTMLENERGKNLYEFWGTKITDAINESLTANPSKTIINLASNEYFKVLQKKQLQAPIITPVFKDFKNGKYKVISFFAKKARGLMSHYIIQNQLTEVEALKGFNGDGYHYDESLSTTEQLVFVR